MAQHNYGAEGIETAFGRKTRVREGVSLDLYATEEPSAGLLTEDKVRYRSEVRALGLIALTVSMMELFIELLALKTSAPGTHAAASASFLSMLWSIVLMNAAIILYRSFDEEWVRQLRRKTQRGRLMLSLRGFDTRDPILWSITSASFIPVAVLGPHYHHDAVFFAAVICAVVGSLGIISLMAGKVRVESRGLRTGNLLSSFDRFIPFNSIRLIELNEKTLTLTSSNGHAGSERRRRIRLLGGAQRLRSALVELAPDGTELRL